MNSIFYKSKNSIVGDLILIASQRGLRAVLWHASTNNAKYLKHYKITDASLLHPSTNPQSIQQTLKQNKILAQTVDQLNEYFKGERRDFEIPFDIETVGTPFQQRVWQCLQKIPFGETISYAEEAIQVCLFFLFFLLFLKKKNCATFQVGK